MLTPKQKARLAEAEGVQINIKGGHATNNTPGLYHPQKQTQKKYKKNTRKQIHHMQLAAEESNKDE